MQVLIERLEKLANYALTINATEDERKHIAREALSIAADLTGAKGEVDSLGLKQTDSLNDDGGAADLPPVTEGAPVVENVPVEGTEAAPVVTGEVVETEPQPANTDESTAQPAA